MSRPGGLQATELTLTCKGMSSVNWDCSDPDFEFVFGNRVCRVHSVLAEFLSPKVARARRSDPLCLFYTLKDSEMFSVLESLVSSLRSGEALRVDNSNFLRLLRLSQELGNTDLLSSLLSMIKTENLTVEEAILLLRTGIDLGTAFSAQFGSLSDFIASHFYKIEKTILDDLNLETAQLLLSSPSLQIEDEDSLYDFVRSRSETDLKFASLFEFIHFEYLCVDRIENFASFVKENLLEIMNTGIWTRICGRLILDAKPKRKNNSHNSRRWTGTEFVYHESRKLDGIIEHLTRECGGNVHDKGIVTVTASSLFEQLQIHLAPYLTVDNGYRNVVDLVADSCYYSKQEPNSWICYDFKERRVVPTSYSVRTYGWGPGHEHLKSWVIDVSNDGIKWTEIDRKEVNNALNREWAIANFNISRVPSEGFRFFRLKQIGPNHKNTDFLAVGALEIFGTLLEK